MAEAWRLAEAGDTASARRVARTVLSSGAHAAAQAEAQELLRRTSTPAPLYLFALLALATLGLLVLLAVQRS